MLQVTFPFEQFLDTSGNPLDNGYVYVGTANLNPETNPVAVYWDDDLTIPAAQPIRTINGYLSNSGTPARLYTSPSIFSITVRDKTQAIVASALDASSLDNLRADLAASTGSSLVGWARNLAGAVATTLYNWMHWRDPSVFEFMTAAQVADVQAGTLTLDVTAAIQAAWNTGQDIRHPRGSYKLTGALTPVGSQKLYGASRQGVYFVQSSAAANGITVSGVANTFIRDIRMACSAVSTAYGIYVTNANPTYLDDIHVSAFQTGIRIESTNNTFVNRPYCVNNLREGIDVVAATDTYLNNIYCGGTANAGLTGVNLALSGACSGVYINGAQLVTGDFNLKTRFLQPANVAGIPSQIFINQMLADSAVGHGVYMEQANETEFSNSWSSNKGTGKNWYIGPQVTDTRIIGSKTFNCVGHGLEIQGIRTSVIGGSYQDASYGAANVNSNIHITGASATGTIVSGVRCYSPNNTAKYGIRVTGTALNTTVSGCDVTGNVTAGYLDDSGVSTNKEINNNGAPGNYTFVGTVTTAAENIGAGGFVRNNIATLAIGGTMDIALPSNGRGVMFAVSSNISQANSTIRTQQTTSVFVYDAESSFTTITTANGSGGGCAYTLTLVTNNTIRLTNTSGVATYAHLSLFGSVQN